MILKQKKFYIINNLYNNLNKFEKNICLFVHTSNLNTLENNQFKVYCDLTEIKTNYIKMSLLKKITKSNILINLLKGPTRLLFFKNFEIFLNFFTRLPLKKKFYPLAILFNNKFYNYLFFYNVLKNIKLSLNNSLLNSKIIQKKIIFFLNKFKDPILSYLYILWNNFIIFLPNYFKKNLIKKW